MKAIIAVLVIIAVGTVVFFHGSAIKASAEEVLENDEPIVTTKTQVLVAGETVVEKETEVISSPKKINEDLQAKKREAEKSFATFVIAAWGQAMERSKGLKLDEMYQRYQLQKKLKTFTSTKEEDF